MDQTITPAIPALAGTVIGALTLFATIWFIATAISSLKDLDARREIIEVPSTCEVCSLVAYLGHKNIQHTVRYTELSPMRFKNFLAGVTHAYGRQDRCYHGWHVRYWRSRG